MDGFFQITGAVLVTVVLSLTLSPQSRNFSGLLSMAVCVMILLLGLRYLEPVTDFLAELESLGNLNREMVKILLKTALIGVLTEITALLCADSGSGSLAQSLRIVGSAVILWLSLPVFRGLLSLVQQILEGI